MTGADPGNFIKREKTSQVRANTPRLSILNSYPNPPPLSKILFPPLILQQVPKIRKSDPPPSGGSRPQITGRPVDTWPCAGHGSSVNPLSSRSHVSRVSLWASVYSIDWSSHLIVPSGFPEHPAPQDYPTE